MGKLRTILAAAVSVVLFGCVTTTPPTFSVIESGRAGGPATNLALGSARIHPILGQSYAYRDDWPVAYHGFVEEDVTFFADVRFDDQRFYDRNNGMQFESDYSRFGVFRR